MGKKQSKKEQQQKGNSYDKILKENILAVFLPLTEKYFGIKIKHSKPLDAKLQRTIEREVDFIRLVETDKGEEFILHIEFQAANESDMIYRMKEYNAIIQRKYKKPIKHRVIYLGTQKMSMRTQLKADEIFTGFEVLDVSKLDYDKLIDSNIPEEVIMAILSNFHNTPPAQVIRSLIEQLQHLSENPKELEKFVIQLEVLAKLRKLETVTIKTIETMPIKYDITTDYVYNRGLMEGRDEERKAQETKQQAEQYALVVMMLTDGLLPIEQIASYSAMSIHEVQAIQEELDNIDPDSNSTS